MSRRKSDEARVDRADGERVRVQEMKSEAVERWIIYGLQSTEWALAFTPSEMGATGRLGRNDMIDLILKDYSGCKIFTIAGQGRKQEDQKEGKGYNRDKR